jgi:hypothetical protein
MYMCMYIHRVQLSLLIPAREGFLFNAQSRALLAIAHVF